MTKQSLTAAQQRCLRYAARRLKATSGDNKAIPQGRIYPLASFRILAACGYVTASPYETFTCTEAGAARAKELEDVE